MAEKHWVDDVKIVRNATTTIARTKLGEFWSSQDFYRYGGDIRFVRIPPIVARAEILPQTKSVMLMNNKNSMPARALPNADVKARIKPLIHETRKTVIYFNSKWMPFVYNVGNSSGKKGIFCDGFNTLEESTIERLNKLSKKFTDTNKADEYLAVDDNGEAHPFVADNFGKVYYRHFIDWFEEVFPGLRTNDEGNRSVKMEVHGFRLLFQLFLRSAGSVANIGFVVPPDECLPNISIDRLLQSSLGRLPNKETTEYIRNKVDSPDVKDNFDKQLEKINRPFFDEKVVTDLSIDDPIQEFVETTWVTFINNISMFPLGCHILLSPNQVILNGDNEVLVSQNEINSIRYRGPKFANEDKRNSVDLVTKTGRLNIKAKSKADKLFQDTLNLKVANINKSWESDTE